ncbi:hypothetical protein BDZ97DRAFT_392401 [Flammula alnicola]|nr:hypothetical protein BDZ97DRAFT_392401 [Flammula alnicola]
MPIEHGPCMQILLSTRFDDNVGRNRPTFWSVFPRTGALMPNLGKTSGPGGVTHDKFCKCFVNGQSLSALSLDKTHSMYRSQGVSPRDRSRLQDHEDLQDNEAVVQEETTTQPPNRWLQNARIQDKTHRRCSAWPQATRYLVSLNLLTHKLQSPLTGL